MLHNRLADLEDFKSETPQAVFRLVDGILAVHVKREAIVDLQTAQRIEHFRKEMTQPHQLPVIIHIPKDYLLFDQEAFRYFGSNDAMQGCIAKAIVLRAPLRVLLLNFSLSFYQGRHPFRIFGSRSQAKMWLFNQLNITELMAES
jgi:hypothetical protein